MEIKLKMNYELSERHNLKRQITFVFIKTWIIRTSKQSCTIDFIFYSILVFWELTGSQPVLPPSLCPCVQPKNDLSVNPLGAKSQERPQLNDVIDLVYITGGCDWAPEDISHTRVVATHHWWFQAHDLWAQTNHNKGSDTAACIALLIIKLY